jgi:hypothetical protein
MKIHVSRNYTHIDKRRNNQTADLEVVLRTGKPVHGILAPTALSIIDDFDFIRALVPEYLHSCCEGVFKLMINIWMAPKFRQCDWFIGNKAPIINKRLAEIEPPHEVTRTHSQESISKVSTWKASMHRSFFLYYFTILEDLLPSAYFEHYCQLVYGMSLLLRDRVAVKDVDKVDVLFRNFVKEFELLYGEEDMRINVHFLTHLPQAVLDWGCLWSTSTFIPEWFNGELAQLCHGSQAVADQMATNHLLRLEVRREVEELMSENALPSHVLHQLKENLNLPMSDDDDESKGLLVNDAKVKLLGNPTSHKSLANQDGAALQTLFSSSDSQTISLGKCHMYPRFKIMSSKSIFTTTSYTLSPKRSNYCALMIDGAYIFIDKIIHFDIPPLVGSTQSFILGRQLGTLSKEYFTPDAVEGTEFSHFPGLTSKLTGIGENPVAYSIADVSTKCVVTMKNELIEKYVVTGLVNKFETD